LEICYCVSLRTLILDLSRRSDKGRDMTNKKFVVKLSSEERKLLNTLISKGKATAKKRPFSSRLYLNGECRLFESSAAVCTGHSSIPPIIGSTASLCRQTI